MPKQLYTIIHTRAKMRTNRYHTILLDKQESNICNKRKNTNAAHLDMWLKGFTTGWEEGTQAQASPNDQPPGTRTVRSSENNSTTGSRTGSPGNRSPVMFRDTPGNHPLLKALAPINTDLTIRNGEGATGQVKRLSEASLRPSTASQVGAEMKWVCFYDACVVGCL